MGENVSDLAAKRCKPCEGGVAPLGRKEADRFLTALPGWEWTDGAIAKRFEFKNYYQTVAFVNAVPGLPTRKTIIPTLRCHTKSVGSVIRLMQSAAFRKTTSSAPPK